MSVKSDKSIPFSEYANLKNDYKILQTKNTNLEERLGRQKRLVTDLSSKSDTGNSELLKVQNNLLKQKVENQTDKIDVLLFEKKHEKSQYNKLTETVNDMHKNVNIEKKKNNDLVLLLKEKEDNVQLDNKKREQDLEIEKIKENEIIKNNLQFDMGDAEGLPFIDIEDVTEDTLPIEDLAEDTYNITNVTPIVSKFDKLNSSMLDMNDQIQNNKNNISTIKIHQKRLAHEHMKPDGFNNVNSSVQMQQNTTQLKGVSLNKASELSGSAFETTKKELVLDLEKDETGDVMSFLLHQNDMNKQVGKKELEEVLEKDAEKIAEQEVEEFSNYQSVELDNISTFYFGSLSVIMLFYIYRSLKK